MAAAANVNSQEHGPVYFWREFEEEPYGYMSQWYPCSFEHEGTTYTSTEMWMMVQKAVLFGDHVSHTQLIGRVSTNVDTHSPETYAGDSTANT